MSDPSITSLVSENFIKVFLRFGVGAIFAGILLGVFIGDVRADQKKNRDEHGRIEQELTQMQNVVGQLLMSQERMVYLQRRQCINTAQTPSDRELCARDRE
jgi:hypothetical protein